MLSIYLHFVNRLNALRREQGQTLAEYALILVLIAIVAIIAVTGLGTTITGVFNEIAGALGVGVQ